MQGPPGVQEIRAEEVSLEATVGRALVLVASPLSRSSRRMPWVEVRSGRTLQAVAKDRNKALSLVEVNPIMPAQDFQDLEEERRQALGKAHSAARIRRLASAIQQASRRLEGLARSQRRPVEALEAQALEEASLATSRRLARSLDKTQEPWALLASLSVVVWQARALETQELALQGALRLALASKTLAEACSALATTRTNLAATRQTQTSPRPSSTR